MFASGSALCENFVLSSMPKSLKVLLHLKVSVKRYETITFDEK